MNFRSRTINNAGTTTWTGAGNINSGVGAVFNNLAGATFDVQNDRSFLFNLGSPAPGFNNLAGATFQKTVAVGTTTMAIFFNNTGTIDVQSGTVNFTGGSTGLPAVTTTATTATIATIAAPDSPPVAHPGGPYARAESEALTLDGSGTSDPDQDPLSYSWDFGDGNT